MITWIPVTTTNPPDGAVVLVHLADNTYSVRQFLDNGRNSLCNVIDDPEHDHSTCESVGEVTHWAELTPP